MAMLRNDSVAELRVENDVARQLGPDADTDFVEAAHGRVVMDPEHERFPEAAPLQVRTDGQASDMKMGPLRFESEAGDRVAVQAGDRPAATLEIIAN
jgi:hypothetical protein